MHFDSNQNCPNPLERTSRQTAVRCVLLLLLAIMIGSAWLFSGSAAFVDQKARVFREQQLEVAATTDIKLVEIDARSLSEISNWPWPRTVHAKIVDRLNEAGVDTVAFDIDFSSHSNAMDDAAFAAALKRFDGTAILPAFRQSAGANSTEILDSEPIDALRQSAMLASVNVFPDSDGVMRRYSSGGETSGVPRPSMPAILANSNGATDESFWISNAIRLESIPRFSAVDILNGNFDKSALQGKTVLIGGTAIEMGDRYATQASGIQPGVVIQVLAAETLLQKLDYPDYGSIPLALLAVGICCGIAFLRSGIVRKTTALVAVAVIITIPFIAEIYKWGTFHSSAALIMLSATYAGLKVSEAIMIARHRRMIDTETGLPNMLNLENSIAPLAGQYLFVMRINNLGDLQGLLGDAGKSQLYAALLQRLSATDAIKKFYLTDNGSLAWSCPLDSIEDASELANAICALMLSPIHPADRPFVIQPSIGIDRVCETHPRGTIQNAVIAANSAANRGSKWLVYTQAMSDRSGHDQLILAGIDRAIADNEIYFLFQPKYSFANKSFCGAEALVRWKHPQAGPIPPDEFIPVLEKNGRMAELTLHSISVVEPILWQWHVEGRDLHIAVNISAPLLSDPIFAEQLERHVQALGNARSLLKLEVTESAGVDDGGEAVRILERLRSMGCKVSIDDYGTGNSTLSYLKQFPADEIKIDKSFITNITSSNADRALVRSTIELAHELGMQVVAEGVETAESAAMLADMKCDVGQGWHFAKPIMLDDLERLFEQPLQAAA